MNIPDGFAVGRAWFVAVSLGAAVATASTVGCGADEPGAQVWGEVVCKGRPLTEGAVILTPELEKSNTVGTGILDQYGRFVIQSSRSDVDLIPGRYSISIRPPKYISFSREKDETPPGYPVPVKYLDAGRPVLFVELKAEPIRLDLSLGD